MLNSLNKGAGYGKNIMNPLKSTVMIIAVASEGNGIFPQRTQNTTNTSNTESRENIAEEGTTPTGLKENQEDNTQKQKESRPIMDFFKELFSMLLDSLKEFMGKSSDKNKSEKGGCDSNKCITCGSAHKGDSNLQREIFGNDCFTV